MTDNIYIPQSGLQELADAIIDGILGAGLVPYTKIIDGTINGTNKAIVDAGGGIRAGIYSATGTPANVGSGASDGASAQQGLYVNAQNGAWNGATWDHFRTPKIFIPVSLVAGTAETTIWTPTTGKKFRLMGFILTCGAASTLTFRDGTGGTVIFAARGGTDQPISPNGIGNGILSVLANNLLTVTRGTSATLDGTVFGTEE